jgi:hypothetical protein
MSETKIKCPKCSFQFPLSEALTKEIEASVRTDLADEFKEKEEQYRQQIEDGKQAAEETLKRAKEQLEARLREELGSQNAIELKDLQESLKEKTRALSDAGEKELVHRRQMRELEDRVNNAELEAEKKLEIEKAKILEKAQKDADQIHRLKDLEKDAKIAQMLSQIEDLKHKAEQGSQKMQGEVFETQLKDNLCALFSFDEILEVAPGIKGGDILQTVKTRSGTEVGKILWELKRTKSFSESWLPKLKADGRACKADICLLVTEALPDEVQEFAEIQGVWCSSIETCIPLAFALRSTLLKVAAEKSIQSGKQNKAELVYDYLTSQEFKGRIEAVVEAFRAMKDDLDSEKRAMERIFAKREKQIQQVILNIAGMHGDLAGLMGTSLPEVKMLQLTEGGR